MMRLANDCRMKEVLLTPHPTYITTPLLLTCFSLIEFFSPALLLLCRTSNHKEGFGNAKPFITNHLGTAYHFSSS